MGIDATRESTVTSGACAGAGAGAVSVAVDDIMAGYGWGVVIRAR